ncbi:MAG: Fic family protein [Oscillospiraceae bacterium]|nr:Fic family protein [Oscillospiraceae bacterium]
MKLDKFKSGIYLQQDNYKSFLPTKINEDFEYDDMLINKLLAEAERELSKLNTYAKLLPNIDLYIKMHVLVEASKSSKIEGTKTSIEENLMDENDIDPEKRDDWEEVQNYVKALNYGVDKIYNELPLCNRLIRDVHRILLSGVRGKYKQPGEFRKSQNWIGGSTLNDAVYIPPHVNNLADLMTDLEKFINNDKLLVPDLIKIAIIHYQFETIHPFLDGNGRVGRLIIPLYLQSKGMLDKPCLYISDFFEKNRASYYDALSKVRESNDIIHWIKFFLNGIIETSKTGSDKFEKIVSLKEETDKKVKELNGKVTNYDLIMNCFYSEPQLSMKKMRVLTNINEPTLRRSINELIKNNMIIEITGSERNRLFSFKNYIDLFK